MFFEGCSFTRVELGLEVKFIFLAELGPTTIPLSADIELSLILVHAEGSPMQPDNITYFINNRQIFKPLPINNNLSAVTAHRIPRVQTRINYLQRADILVFTHFVWEG